MSNFEGYTSAEVATVTNTSRKSLDSYISQGLVGASVSPGKGKGADRRFSLADVVAVDVLRFTRSTGVHLKYLKPGLDAIREQDDVESIPENTALVIPAGRPVRFLTFDPTKTLPAGLLFELVTVTVPIGLLVKAVKFRLDVIRGVKHGPPSALQEFLDQRRAEILAEGAAKEEET